DLIDRSGEINSHSCSMADVVRSQLLVALPLLAASTLEISFEGAALFLRGSRHVQVMDLIQDLDLFHRQAK
ncbi:MAG: hypothetical protein ACJ72D_20760, partial [Marmoricola sp.]